MGNNIYPARAGEVLRLWTQATSRLGRPLPVTVDLVEKHRIWITAPGLSLEVGEDVLVERPVQDDARYQAALRVGSPREIATLELV